MTSRNSAASVPDARQMVFFCLADEQFALDISMVREIIRLPSLTRLPGTPDYVAGIVNLRGEILPVLDTRLRLSLRAGEPDDRTRILVTENRGILAGLLVDSVLTVNEVADSAIQMPPPAVQVDSRFLSGVIQDDSSSVLTLILDPDAIMEIEIETRQEGIRSAGSSAHCPADSGAGEDIIDELQLVTFALGDEEYAFEVEGVREIMRVGAVSDVPNAPDYIKGLITVRNRVMPAFDLRRLLGMDCGDECRESERILIVETEEMTIGMLVDRMSEVARYPRKKVQQPPESDEMTELKGIVQMDNGRLIMILNQEKLVSGDDSRSISQWMDEEEPEDMAGRSDENAVERDASSVSEDYVQLVSFNLGDEEYGIEITQIQEINRLGVITSMPRAPEFIEGVTNLRGEVIPVIDTRRRFGLPAKEKDDRTRIIIVDIAGRKTGLVTDRVNEVMRISRADIAPPPPVIAAREEARFFSGIGRLENGDRMVLLLDVEKILSPDEQEELRQMPSDKTEAKKRKTSGKKTASKTSSRKKTAGSAARKGKGGRQKKKTGELEIEE